MTQINHVEDQPSPGRDTSVRELILRERIWREIVIIYGLGISGAAGICALLIGIALLT
jgi:hypothetical protein